jgi:Icc-related predicted phosphoesterase
MLIGRSGLKEKQRVFFATDIHGSDTCWRKFLRCAEFYEADLLVLGGDVTGKALVPIVDDGGGRYRVTLQDQLHELEGGDELAQVRAGIRARGLYPVVLTQDELDELQSDPERLDALFQAEVLRVMEEWVALADERLPGTGTRCFLCPGNDDDFGIDAPIEASPNLELAEGQVVELGNGYQLLSTGWSNVTPWRTHREESEDRHAERIGAMVRAATAPPERLVFNFHCPPHGTMLDEAPKITEDLEIVDGGRAMAHVGSTAVRDAIREVEPALSLHGHIHESRAAVRLGRTLAVNPGSLYEQGVLQGVLVDLDCRDPLSRHMLTTG